MRYIDPLLRVGRRILSSRTKRFLKRIWDPNQNITLTEARLLSRARERRRLWPFAAVPRAQHNPGTSPQIFDIICFGIFDWNFRFQRPQQILSEFARRGHRVFYVVNAQLHHAREPFTIRSVAENVWQIRMEPSFDLYDGALTEDQQDHLHGDIAAVRRLHHITTAVQIVQFPAWWPVARSARDAFGWKIVYDCMDDWEHMEKVGEPARHAELELVTGTDVLVVSSQKLKEKWAHHGVSAVKAPNAADFHTFSNPVGGSVLGAARRPVIGYFGAIAEWFDLDLVAKAAAARPDFTFVLVGDVTHPQAARLRSLKNVVLTGEKPYALMPVYLSDFDVCIIPFRSHPVIESTDPVKLYEYFSQGKPVVATAMRELRGHAEPVLYQAEGVESFVACLDRALAEPSEVREARIAIARRNTWPIRVDRMEAAIVQAHPLVSMVLLTYGNLEYSLTCIESLFRNTLYPNFEVVVVDNASPDGTAAALQNLAVNHPRLRVLLNERNEGFAAGMNRGLREARGETLVLLNNDTVLPNGWLSKLIRHLEDDTVGLVVTVTNFSGNESRIHVTYRNLDEMEDFARTYTMAHEGQEFDIPVAAMYCVAMRRSVFEKVGPLDERFSIGMFEDDDYSHRVRVAGYRVICAEDAFVHHFGQASFRKLSTDEYSALFDRNRRLYEEKWNVTWEQHQARKR
jgi:GT2 family glycosyltransferase/glycosyltransferase involved in cell wall biosynthesis